MNAAWMSPMPASGLSLAKAGLSSAEETKAANSFEAPADDGAVGHDGDVDEEEEGEEVGLPRVPLFVV